MNRAVMVCTFAHDKVAANIDDSRHSAKRHRSNQFVLQNLDRPAGSRLTRCTRAIERRSSDENAAGTECKRFHDVPPASDAAINENRELVSNGGGDGGQRIERGDAAIELTPAMVRNDDRVHAEPCRANGIVRVHDALDDELFGPVLANFGESTPIEGRIVVATHGGGLRSGIVGTPGKSGCFFSVLTASTFRRLSFT